MPDKPVNPLHFRKTEDSPARSEETRTWNVLIVDDDPEVHALTKLVLGGKEALERKLKLYFALSAAESKSFLLTHDDIAVILLDVVMETDDAGLLLARWIRNELGNHRVRIILRTGYPGKAPESRIITEYEINDYKEKTELTYEKIWSAVVTAIRGYRDIRTIERSRDGMEMILKAAPELFKFQSLRLFASGVLTQLVSVLSAEMGAALINVSGFTASLEGSLYRVLATAGRFNKIPDDDLLAEMGEEGVRLLHEATERDDFVSSDGDLALCIHGKLDERNVIFIEDCGNISDISRDIIALFGTNVAAAFTNISLINDLNQRLEEKNLLIREINHRVKNNIQMILSLMDLAKGSEKESALAEIKRRINALALIHDYLSSAPNETRIDFADIATDMANEIACGTGLPEGMPAITASSRGFLLPLDIAIPSALLVEELLSCAVAESRAGTEIRLDLEGGDEDGRTIRVRYVTAELATESAVAAGPGAEIYDLSLARELAGQIHGSLSRENLGGEAILACVFDPHLMNNP